MLQQQLQPEALEIKACNRYSLHVYLQEAQAEESQDQCQEISVSRVRITFADIPSSLYEAINIDQTKCLSYREQTKKEDTHRIKSVAIELAKGQEIEACKYEEYLQQVLEYLDGKQRDKFELTKKNQFDFIKLCDIFQLTEVKFTLMTYLSQNFDIHNVFEFLRISASEPDNKEAMRESYWIIVYIYLRKIAWDISDSFQNEKTKAMLQSVNPHDFIFSQGFLVHEKTQKKIDLSCFVQTAIEEAQEKAQYLALNNMHNLTKVNRIKSEDRLLSDYPHYYSLKMEGREDVRLHGMRNSENGEFIISSIKGNFTLYGRGFLGIVQPNFLGTKFEVYDFGIEPGYIQTSNLPRDFLPTRKRVSTIEYDTNFFAEKPRSFRVSIVEEQKGQHSIERHLENLAPRFNEQRGCYTLNFYGRVSKASARNFQLIETDGDEDEIILSHGKFQRNEFNLDFRAPVNQLKIYIYYDKNMLISRVCGKLVSNWKEKSGWMKFIILNLQDIGK